MAYKFVTALQRALSDPLGYFQFQKEMQAKAMDQVFLNTFAGKTSFQAVVLPERINSEDQATLGQAIRVRPIGIHDFLIPEPCEFSDDEEKLRSVLLMHPVAYPAETSPFNRSGIDSTSNEPQHIAYGDTVECFFTDGPQYSGRLRGLRYRKATSRVSSAINIECLSVFGVTNLKSSFSAGGYSSGVPALNAVAGSAAKDAPLFNKGQCPNALSSKSKWKDLPRRQTFFYRYTPEQLLAFIKSIPGDEYYKKLTFMFISHEQPAKIRGGELLHEFPNNNPAGLQTDVGGFRGITFSDIDYQSCYKDAETWRAFAGFETPERGVTAVYKAIRNKDREGIVPVDTSLPEEEQIRLITRQYYDAWNLNATSDELDLLERQGFFIRKSTCKEVGGCIDAITGKKVNKGARFNKKVVRNFSRSKLTFKRSLNKWKEST